MYVWFFDSVYRYDKDRNHEPCQRNGHKAHWACASGKKTVPEVSVVLAA